MVNGTGQPVETEQTIIRVNLGLTWKHLAAGVAMFGSVVGGLTTAGWLALPAKQDDLVRVERRLDLVQKDLQTQQGITLKLIEAVERLDTTVKTIRTAAPKPRAKAKP